MFGKRKKARSRGTDTSPRDSDAASNEEVSFEPSHSNDEPLFTVVENSDDAPDQTADDGPESPGPSDATGNESETADNELEPAEAEQESSLSGGIDADYINAKVQKVVDSIQGLEHLSELVSLRYNPFLEVGENDVFDGKRLQPDELVHEYFNTNGNGVEQVSIQQQSELDNEFPEFMEVAHVPRRKAMEDLDESIDLTDLPIDQIHSAVGRPLAETEPDPEPEAGGRATPAGHGVPLGSRDRARRTLLVFSWFRRLQSHGPPAALFLFIDHCRRMEWIDEPSYRWLTDLAMGVTEPDPELSWNDLKLDPIQLTQIHEANLLFLDDLFTDRLRMGERGYLKSHIQDYFEDP